MRSGSLALVLAAALAAPSAYAQQERADGRPDPVDEPTAEALDGSLLGEVGDLAQGAWDVPGQLVVDLRDDLPEPELAGLAQALGLALSPTRLADETRMMIATLAPADVEGRLAQLRADPRVERAEPLARVRALFVPNDPMFKEQWHLSRIGATQAWDFATGTGVTVAVVDTGIACETYGPFTKGTDLAQTTCVEGFNLVAGNAHANDDQGHGTHVAGTIAQSTNNGLGVGGVAFGARLMPVKVLNELGWGTTADVADGIRWAADHGAHVINLSLGGPRNSTVLQAAIDHAVARGVVVVAAAGNTGGRVQYPGASDGVLGVSATDEKDRLARFSSRGEGVDVAAPGVNVVQQTICNGGKAACERFPGWSGTSMAAPHVAGAAALLVSLGVTDPVAVEDALRRTARVVDDSDGGRKLYGAGVLDAGAAARDATLRHLLARLLALVVVSAWAYRSARRKNAAASSPLSLGFLVAALAAGPGLLFFAPWVLPRASALVDLAARPLPDLDLYIGASLHRWLPLANVGVPLLLTVVAFGVRRARPVIAGVCAGLAAYLLSVAWWGDAVGPLGATAMRAWALANALGCAWFARLHLRETT